MFGPLQDPQRSYSGTKILHLTLEENLHKLHLMNCLTIFDTIRAFQNFYGHPSRPLCLYHGAAPLDKAGQGHLDYHLSQKNGGAWYIWFWKAFQSSALLKNPSPGSCGPTYKEAQVDQLIQGSIVVFLFSKSSAVQVCRKIYARKQCWLETGVWQCWVWNNKIGVWRVSLFKEVIILNAGVC